MVSRVKQVGRGRTGRTSALCCRVLQKAVRHIRSSGMVRVAEAQQLKAKLMLKGKFRPEKMIRKKMPDGSGMIAKMPRRRRDQGGGDAAAADKEYCNAINKISSVFGKQKRSNTTAAEHRMYMRMIDGWLVRKGFGSYVEADVNKHGELVAVHPRRTATGEIKVVKPQMVIGYLLEMASGSKDTPKGGHASELLARAGQEVMCTRTWASSRGGATCPTLQ